MKYLIIIAIVSTVFIFRLFYCAGELNEKWDDSNLDDELEKDFDQEQNK